jgi:hypothetical protein
MANEERRGVVRVDGEAPYVLTKSVPFEGLQDNSKGYKSFLGPDDYKAARQQTKKNWGWQEGTPFNDETVREKATSGRMTGHESLNSGYGHELHKGTITKGEEGRTHFSLNSPVKGFSNNKVVKRVMNPEPMVGKGNSHLEANDVSGSKIDIVESGELTVHCAPHKYTQPKRL